MRIKKNLYCLLGILLAAMIIFGIVLIAVQYHANGKFVKSVTLKGDGITQSELSFSAGGLKPSDSRDYTLELGGEIDGTYSIKLVFSEKSGTGLSDFMNVSLYYEDDGKQFALNELFEGTAIEFDCKIKRSAPAQVRLVFSMPDDVGNVAQGKDTDFLVTLTAKRV